MSDDTGWSAAIAEWQTWMRAAGRPETTRGLRVYQLRRFADAHPEGPWSVTTDGILRWLAQEGWAAETRRSFRAALRTFYGWAHASGRLDHNPAGLLPPIRPARHAPRPAPERAVADALLSADDRQRLMVLLAVREGLRRGEIARVHSDDLIEEAGGWSLRVHGKGDKIRVVPLSDDVALELMVLPSGWAFPGQVDGHLSPEYVGKLVSRLLPDGWTTHTLRHRFATNAYAQRRASRV